MKLRKRFALLRQWRLGRELSRALRESLLLDGVEGWVIRDSQGSGNTTIEYDGHEIQGGGVITLKLLPCTFYRCCQTVQVCVDGAPVWLPPLAKLLLRNAVRLFVLRRAEYVADHVLGN